MNKQERRFQGIWIPAEIWLSKELIIQEKIMLVEICSLDNDEGCFATNSYFAEFFNLSKARVSQIIKGLEEKGLIIIKYTYKGNEIDKRIIKVNHNKLLDYLGIKYINQGIKYTKGYNNNINIINQNNITSNNSIKSNSNLEINNINIIDNEEKKQKRLNKKKLKEQQEAENEIAINNLIDQFTDNADIQELLEQYVEIRKQKGLTPSQFYIILDDLKKECKDNDNYTINCIRKAIAGGWSQIVFVDSFKGKCKTSYGSFDNTAGHFTGNKSIKDEDLDKLTFEEKKQYISKMALADMTSKQKEFFNTHCLAKDEKGNNLEF